MENSVQQTGLEDHTLAGCELQCTFLNFLKKHCFLKSKVAEEHSTILKENLLGELSI